MKCDKCGERIEKSDRFYSLNLYPTRDEIDAGDNMETVARFHAGPFECFENAKEGGW